MNEQVEKEVQEIINELRLNCSIEEFKSTSYWPYLEECRPLSEDFIKEFGDKVSWIAISMCQKLSEEFIIEFKDKFHGFDISKYQKLSENFIREFKDYVSWVNISKYQKLSAKFRKEFGIKVSKTNWLYKSKKFKLKHIKENTNYEVVDDEYIIAYKSVRKDRSSYYNCQYQYLDGETYESHCDCNIDNGSSFGLSAWTLEGAKDFRNEGKILKVKIAIEDIGAIVHDGQKIRCSKLTIIGEV